jgi:hypothetical protein
MAIAHHTSIVIAESTIPKQENYSTAQYGTASALA